MPVAHSQAEVKLANVFGDHMVLQREMAAPVWGWADPDEVVTVAIADQSKQATADADGKWLVKLDALSAGGPFTLTASGSNKVTVSDVLVGEVWLCSGQSNMAMTVNRAQDFDKEQQNANFPLIRHFKTTAHATPQPQADCAGEWSVCSSDTVGNFSATAYFFGRKLHQELKVPIGLINSSWGGTDIAAWTSLPAQQAVDAIVPKLEAFDATIAAYDPAQAKATYEAALAAWEKRAAAAKQSGKPVPRKPRLVGDPQVDQNRPANLFNGMIHPLIPYAIRGATWYQGERNSHSIEDGILYETQLKTLIADWRTHWDEPKLRFLIVQLPNFHAFQQEPVETTGWVALRESQQSVYRNGTYVGLVVTTDIGEATDIHPKNKQAVGDRLARFALAEQHDPAMSYTGPSLLYFHLVADGIPTSDNPAGGAMRVGFTSAKGLKTADCKPFRGLAVAGEDQVFHHAEARVERGRSADNRIIESDVLLSSVIVWSKHVQKPVAVRYNWADNPIGNLVNSAGLPASPFRTDTWNLTQED
ncbi:MAG: sialate O-acetylesterase [Planctomycetota bacterium]